MKKPKLKNENNIIERLKLLYACLSNNGFAFPINGNPGLWILMGADYLVRTWVVFQPKEEKYIFEKDKWDITLRGKIEAMSDDIKMIQNLEILIKELQDEEEENKPRIITPGG